MKFCFITYYPNELCDTTCTYYSLIFYAPTSQQKQLLLYILIRPLKPHVFFVFLRSICTTYLFTIISPMLKGLENIEDEILSSLFDVISPKREDVENKWKNTKKNGHMSD